MQVEHPRGTLAIWTDVEPGHEDDFNRWYDREHMQERAAIPGFRYARRFRCIEDRPGRYLALYTTSDIGVFTSQAYRHAFANQSAWSRKNFARMVGTRRRVGELIVEAGDVAGEGAVLSLFVLPDERAGDAEAISAALDAEVADHGLTCARVLRTVPSLSVSLTDPDALSPPADALVMVEGCDPHTTRRAPAALARRFEIEDVRTFSLLWRLAATDH